MFEDSIKVMALARAHLSPFNKFRKIFLDFSDKSFSVNSAEKLDDCRTFFKVGETLLRWKQLTLLGKVFKNVLKYILNQKR
jgi:hypothetical protein